MVENRMSLSRILVRFVFAFACLFAALPAQDELRYVIPEKFERATKTDDKGLVQWDEHQQVKCVSCSGTGKTKCTTCVRFADDATICVECKRNKEREVVCRPCAGLGYFPDPLEKVLCAGCLGASFLLCTVCSGGGQVRVGEDKRYSACPSCRGEGGFKCGICNGARTCEVAGVKPSLKEASSANLAKAIATTDQALAGLASFTPTGANSRKEVKELVKQLQIAQALYGPMKKAPKVLEDYMGKIYGGANFKGHEEDEVQAMGTFKANAEYYLKHQKRMMELAKKRAEANEKVQAENKAK